MRFRNHTTRVGSVVLYLLLIASVIYVPACSAKPSESRVKSDVEKILSDDWPGTFKMTSFNKVNEEGDSHNYTIHYHYTAEILQDTDGYSSGGRGSAKTHISAVGDFKWIKTKLPLIQPMYGLGPKNPSAIKKGDTFEVTNITSYRKTEKGWL